MLLAASLSYMATLSQINLVEFMSTVYKFQLLSLLRQHKNLPGGNLSNKQLLQNVSASEEACIFLHYILLHYDVIFIG